MPNWCNNNIRLYGDEKTIKVLTNVIKSLSPEERLFQSLIGLPNGMTEDDYAKSWYDTNTNWFGTKWDIDVNTDCFDFSDDEIEFSCETAWAPPIAFLDNLCRMYKVNAYIYYAEPGMAFSGETKFIWEDGELSVEDNEYEYRHGLYVLSNEEFWYEVQNDIEYAIEEDIDVEEFVKDFKSYATEKDIEEIKTMFNTQKKEYEEQQSEVE